MTILFKWVFLFDYIRTDFLTILVHREGMKVKGNVVDQLVESTGSDIRQILNMLSTWRLNRQDMSFDESQKLSVPRPMQLFLLGATYCNTRLGSTQRFHERETQHTDSVQHHPSTHWSLLMVQDK